MNCTWHRLDSKAWGSDGHLELKRRGQSTGLMFGVQVKSGRSYVKRETPQEYFIGGISPEHLSYWRTHCLPFLLIWFDETRKKAFWTYVGKDDAITWNTQIPVPKASRFGVHVKKQLLRLAFEFFDAP